MRFKFKTSDQHPEEGIMAAVDMKPGFMLVVNPKGLKMLAYAVSYGMSDPSYLVGMDHVLYQKIKASPPIQPLHQSVIIRTPQP